MTYLTLENAWSAVFPILNAIFEKDNYQKKREHVMFVYANVYLYCFKRDHDNDLNSSWLFYIKSFYKSHNIDGQCYFSSLQDVYLNPSYEQPSALGTRGLLFYLKLKDFLISFCESLDNKISNLADEDLLRFHNSKWKNYVSKHRILDCAFSYLNRAEIVRVYNEDSSCSQVIYKVSVLAVVTWKETLIKKYNDKIVKAAMKLINRERRGETIDSTLISDLIKCYLALGICVDGKNDSLCVYKNEFEKLFLEETENFYDKHGKLLQGNNVKEYFEEVKERFREEKKRVSDYLHSSTEELLMKIVYRFFIHRHLDLFCYEFQKLLKLGKNDAFTDLFSFVFMYYIMEDILSELANAFEKYVFEEGLASIEGCGEVVKSDPKIYTHAILVVYKKYVDMVNHSFSGNNIFRIALEKATKGFINKNIVTLKPNTVRKTSELLTKYCDQLLRKNCFALDKVSKTSELEPTYHSTLLKNGNCKYQDKDYEKVLDVLSLFKFIEDKDVFLKYYLKFLVKRLLTNTYKDVDLEADSINKMKPVICDQNTIKMERMVQDIKLTNDLNRKFAETYRKTLNFDFQVLVLRNGLWPFDTAPSHTLPSELEKCVTQFSKLYMEKHSGKRLCWMYNHSKGEIFMNNYKNRYTIEASIRQISILLLYNSSTSWTLSQIHEKTDIDLDIILQLIPIFLKTELLICKHGCENLTRNSMISLNEAYNNENHHININIPLKPDTNKTQEAVDKNIDEARKFIIQAMIVRIMKSQKTMKEVELVSKISQGLTWQFKPDPDMIKICIKVLVHKEYIQHSSTDANTFIYVA